MNESYSLKVTFFLSRIKEHQSTIEFKLQKHLANMRKAATRINPKCFDFALLKDFLINFAVKRLKRHLSINERSVLLLIITSFEALFNKDFESFTNLEWLSVTSFFPFMSFFRLKYEFFLWIKPNANGLWTTEMNHLMLRIINENHLWPTILSRSSSRNVQWRKISYDFSTHFEELSSFKTNKQCKERWWNHLNPLNDKTAFSPQEDILLLEKALEFGPKWTSILSHFEGRNQHQIKNRFIFLLSKHESLAKQTIRRLIQTDTWQLKTTSVLNNLKETALIAPIPLIPENPENYLEKTPLILMPKNLENMFENTPLMAGNDPLMSERLSVFSLSKPRRSASSSESSSSEFMSEESLD